MLWCLTWWMTWLLTWRWTWCHHDGGHDTFKFLFCQRLWALTKRRDDIAVANMVDDMAADIFKVYKAWNVLKQRVLGRNCLMRNVPACLLSFPSLLFCELLNYQWSLITHLFLHIFQTFCCEDEGAEIPAICLRPINVLQRDAVSRECAIENCHRGGMKQILPVLRHARL